MVCVYLIDYNQWGLHPSTDFQKTQMIWSILTPQLHFFLSAWCMVFISRPVFLFSSLFTFASSCSPNYKMDYLTKCQCIFLSCLYLEHSYGIYKQLNSEIQKVGGKSIIFYPPMPQTSFAVGYLQQYTPSDGFYWQLSQASGWFFLHHSVLGTPFQSCERASGPSTRAAGGGFREGPAGMTWPLGVSVAALEGGLWPLSLAARNASCFPHITQVNKNEVTFIGSFSSAPKRSNENSAIHSPSCRE